MSSLDKLGQADLLLLVKTAQKQRLAGPNGEWNEYLKAKYPRLKLADPAKHKREALMGFIEGLTSLKVLHIPSSTLSSYGGSAPAVGGGNNSVQTSTALPSRGGNNVQTGGGGSADDGHLKDVSGILRQPDGAPGSSHQESAPLPVEGQPVSGDGRLMRRLVEWTRWRNEAKQRFMSNEEASTSEDAQKAEVCWKLIMHTRKHARYETSYDLPSFKKGWAFVKRRATTGGGGGVMPRLYALDCEMVETDIDNNSLVGLCLVDETGKAVYKTLVRPKGAIFDYRTRFTGLTEEDLKDVTLSRQEARKAVKKILGKGSVLVGHALHNDLKALRLDHRDVIDTAFVFGYKGLPQCNPGLKDLAKSLLDITMRKGEDGHHDSFEDAAVTMKLVHHAIALGGDIQPLSPPEIKVPKEDLCKLLVHGIPRGLTEAHLQALFPGEGVGTGAAEGSEVKSPETAGAKEQEGASKAANPGPLEVASEKKKKKKNKPGKEVQQGVVAAIKPSPVPAFESIEGNLSDKKVFLLFRHAGIANEAFKKLQGLESVDNMGRANKTVIAAPGLKVRIRKMACHNGLLFGRDKAAEREAAREEAAKAKAKTGSATKATATGRKRPVRGRGPSGPTANKRHKAAVPAEGGS